MPDQIKILEPKEDDANIQPHVISNVQQEVQEQTQQWVDWSVTSQ